MKTTPNVAGALAALALAAWGLSAGAQTAGPSPTPTPLPAVTPAPRLRLPAPVLIHGRPSATVSFASGDTQTIAVSQAGAPNGTSFLATGSFLCAGAISVSDGTPGVLHPGPVSTSGTFSIARLGNTTGCTLAISSTAGGSPATVDFR